MRVVILLSDKKMDRTDPCNPLRINGYCLFGNEEIDRVCVTSRAISPAHFSPYHLQNKSKPF